jgi:RNA polymerase sigma factor (sigma-70 family)
MDDALTRSLLMPDQDERISRAVEQESARLRNFIRRYVSDPAEAEDVLQDVFYELVQAYRMMKPVEQVAAWLFRVARNRTIDLFRRRKREQVGTPVVENEEGELLRLEDLLPSPEAGPEAAYARTVLLEELDAALDELPPEQRDVFVAHEMMGKSFKEIAAETGVRINTLLSRKRYAVLHLRERLSAIYKEFDLE